MPPESPEVRPNMPEDNNEFRNKRILAPQSLFPGNIRFRADRDLSAIVFSESLLSSSSSKPLASRPITFWFYADLWGKNWTWGPLELEYRVN
jgi:hypothetical protein